MCAFKNVSTSAGCRRVTFVLYKQGEYTKGITIKNIYCNNRMKFLGIKTTLVEKS